MLLAILSEGESYGYAIIKRVRELSDDQLKWTEGMLYPVLHRLEREELIVAEWKQANNGRKRKYYRLTGKGKRKLASDSAQWQAMVGAMESLGMTVGQPA